MKVLNANTAFVLQFKVYNTSKGRRTKQHICLIRMFKLFLIWGSEETPSFSYLLWPGRNWWCVAGWGGCSGGGSGIRVDIVGLRSEQNVPAEKNARRDQYFTLYALAYGKVHTLTAVFVQQQQQFQLPAAEERALRPRKMWRKDMQRFTWIFHFTASVYSVPLNFLTLMGGVLSSIPCKHVIQAWCVIVSVHGYHAYLQHASHCLPFHASLPFFLSAFSLSVELPSFLIRLVLTHLKKPRPAFCFGSMIMMVYI